MKIMFASIVFCLLFSDAKAQTQADTLKKQLKSENNINHIDMGYIQQISRPLVSSITNLPPYTCNCPYPVEDEVTMVFGGLNIRKLPVERNLDAIANSKPGVLFLP